jgi:hypothetical protein
MNRPLFLVRHDPPAQPFYADDPKFRRLDTFPRTGPPRWLAWLLVVLAGALFALCVVWGASLL